MFWIDAKLLTLLQILSSQGATDNVNVFFFLSNSKVYSVVHHFSQHFKFLGRNVEEEDLRWRDVLTPIELISFITTNDKHILFINHYDLPFTDFLIKDLETGPLQSFEIIVSMLIQLGKVKELLWEATTLILTLLYLGLKLLILNLH
jgi:hypothetical protein